MITLIKMKIFITNSFDIIALMTLMKSSLSLNPSTKDLLKVVKYLGETVDPESSFY